MFDATEEGVLTCSPSAEEGRPFFFFVLFSRIGVVSVAVRLRGLDFGEGVFFFEVAFVFFFLEAPDEACADDGACFLSPVFAMMPNGIGRNGNTGDRQRQCSRGSGENSQTISGSVGQRRCST